MQVVCWALCWGWALGAQQQRLQGLCEGRPGQPQPDTAGSSRIQLPTAARGWATAQGSPSQTQPVPAGSSQFQPDPAGSCSVWLSCEKPQCEHQGQGSRRGRRCSKDWSKYSPAGRGEGRGGANIHAAHGEPHPSWPQTLSVMGHPQLLWITCSSVTAPSQERISS